MTQPQPQLQRLTLYHTPWCPYCIAVVMEMQNMGMTLEKKDVSADEQARSALIAGGGKSQVPCLEIKSESGESNWLYESQDIIRYLRQNMQ